MSSQFIPIPPSSTVVVSDQPEVFPLSPLIKITLVNLYLALTVPLPILAQVTQSSLPLTCFLTAGLAIGLLILVGALSEEVVVTRTQITVRYPRWIPDFFRSGWQLPWSEITEIKCRTTGQGGLVYYFITSQADRAYLLPMRVAGFNRLTQLVSHYTAIDANDVRPLSQPWMYLLLFFFTFILWGSELAIGLLVWTNPPLA